MKRFPVEVRNDLAAVSMASAVPLSARLRLPGCALGGTCSFRRLWFGLCRGNPLADRLHKFTPDGNDPRARFPF